MDMSEASEVPGWLSALLSEKKFFHPCRIHVDAKKNEMNVFCLDCCKPICPHCLIDHPSHRLLQIRRYMYQDVIRIDDAGIINCDRIQTYITNHAKVVFLNQRPPKQSTRDSGRICRSCDRTVQQSSLYCCLSCKLKRALRSRGKVKLPINLQSCGFPVLPDASDDVQMTPESVLEPAGSMLTESGSSSGGPYLSSTETTEVVQKECNNSPVGAFGTGPGSENSPSYRRNRRKGTPHRSPRH